MGAHAAGELRHLGPEGRHLRRPPAMLERILVPFGRAAAALAGARNGIVRFVRQKRGRGVPLPSGLRDGIVPFVRRKFFVRRGRAAIGALRNGIVRFVRRKKFCVRAQQAGTRSCAGGLRLAAEPAMTNRIAVAGRRPAPALHRVCIFRYRQSSNRHALTPDLFPPPLLRISQCASTAKMVVSLHVPQCSHAWSAGLLAVAFARSLRKETKYALKHSFKAFAVARVSLNFLWLFLHQP